MCVFSYHATEVLFYTHLKCNDHLSKAFTLIMSTFPYNFYFSSTFTKREYFTFQKYLLFVCNKQQQQGKERHLPILSFVSKWMCLILFFSSTTRNRARLLDTEDCLVPILSPTGVSEDLVARKHRAKGTTTDTERV